jgi:hypothetical protein
MVECDEFVREPGQYPTIPGQRDPRWYTPDDVTSVDAQRCPDTWDFGSRVGKVQCSREDGHEGCHFANGDNPFGIYYRWGFIPKEAMIERGADGSDTGTF